jgi:hypothetical protein
VPWRCRRRRHRYRARVFRVWVLLAALVVPTACDDGGGGFCDAAKELESASGLEADLGVGSPPDEVIGAYQRTRDALARMNADAPDELRGDTGRALDAYDQIVAAVERNGGDLSRAGGEITALLDDAATSDSLALVVQYATDECDL